MVLNAIDRLYRALSHQEVDRPPVVGVNTSVTVEMMNEIGITWPQAHNDPQLMFKLGAAAYEICGLESLKIPFDMTVEAGALGAQIDYGSMDTLPQVKDHLFNEAAQLMVGDEFIKKGRIPLVLEAIRLAKMHYGEKVPIISSIVGPFSLAAMLYGFENLFYWMLTQPDEYHSALEKVTNICIAYAEKHYQAGSHVIQIGEASASGDLISDEHYRKYVVPYQAMLCQNLKLPKVIHICGNISGHLKYIAATGMDGISFDHKTDVDLAVQLLKGKVALIGYIPTALLQQGTPEEVYVYSQKCIANRIDILNAGCAWPPSVPNSNIRAMVRAGQNLSM